MPKYQGGTKGHLQNCTGGIMKEIYNMLKRENVRILSRVENWKEAIHVAVQPLVDGGYCESRYIDEIIKNTEKLGPYYVLCENLALVHGSSDQGVLKRQMAVTLLREPIKFKEDGYDVRVLVTLAATDPESHMEALQAMSELFSTPESVEEVLNAETTDEIFNLFVHAVDE